MSTLRTLCLQLRDGVIDDEQFDFCCDALEPAEAALLENARDIAMRGPGKPQPDDVVRIALQLLRVEAMRVKLREAGLDLDKLRALHVDWIGFDPFVDDPAALTATAAVELQAHLHDYCAEVEFEIC